MTSITRRFDGLHADRAAAADVPGALFACADHGTIDKSDGTTWVTWATADDPTAQTTLATNERALHTKASQAVAANTNDITANDAFLAIASPTNANVVAQVKELTRQSTRQARELNALIRLVLRRFDAAD